MYGDMLMDERRSPAFGGPAWPRQSTHKRTRCRIIHG